MPGINLQRRSPTLPFMASLAHDADQLHASVRRMFENPFAMLPAPFAFTESIGWLPPVEIAESESALTLTAELPGLDRKDVRVELDGDVLTLRGEKREERRENDRRYHLEERSYGAFQRAFTPPPAVDREKITAEFDRGVLTLHLPKSTDVRPRGREIPVAAKVGARLRTDDRVAGSALDDRMAPAGWSSAAVHDAPAVTARLRAARRHASRIGRRMVGGAHAGPCRGSWRAA